MTGTDGKISSQDEFKKTCISLPRKVLVYLKIKSASEGKPMQSLILEAIKGYFKMNKAS